MTKTSSEAEKIVELLERIIDTRYMMLKEWDFENHRYVACYKENNYDPLIVQLKDLLQEKI
jgi:hypothetical protein